MLDLHTQIDSHWQSLSIGRQLRTFLALILSFCGWVTSMVIKRIGLVGLKLNFGNQYVQNYTAEFWTWRMQPALTPSFWIWKGGDGVGGSESHSGTVCETMYAKGCTTISGGHCMLPWLEEGCASMECRAWGDRERGGRITFRLSWTGYHLYVSVIKW